MKRPLTSILIVVVLVAAGLLLALVCGRRPVPTELGSPLSPLESAFSPRLTPPPIPAPWPDVVARMRGAEELLTVPQNASSRLAVLPRIIAPNTDGKTLVGVIRGDTDMIVAIDLTSGALRVLADRLNYPDEPQVSGSNVVWTTFGSLYLYNLDSGEMTQKNFDIARYAHISGNVVIWEQDGGNVRGLDLKSKDNFPIATRPDVFEMQPEISGEWVIFSTPPVAYNFSELWAINIRTQETIRLGDFPVYDLDDSTRKRYAIDAPLVVWSSAAELHLYNLDTRNSFAVPVEQCIVSATVPGGSTQRWRPENLAISESVVISDGCGQQIGYDVERRVFFSLPLLRPETPRGEFDDWTMANNRLVWILTEEASDGQEHSRIFTAQIERSP